MRILVFSTLFPNAAAPGHGVFVENRLKAYLKKHRADVKVVAPVPWFPFSHPVFGRYADYARAPRREMRSGVEVFHPRFVTLPKLGMQWAPQSLTRTLFKQAEALIDAGWEFDFIDAHYFYPDAVAAAAVARKLGKPFVATARGSDISLLPSFEGLRRKILDAAWRADAVISVADALRRELVRLGAPAEKITVLRNGVDLETFSPVQDREAERRALGLDGLVLASVGQLIERKGHGFVIDALKQLPAATLLIAGEGPDRKALETRASAAGVAGRVRFLGQVGHEDLKSVYSAADILVLASSREGWPNVLLEAMACGAPCVATDVWGSGEVIRAPEAGRLVKERGSRAIAAAISDLLSAPPGRKNTRLYAERHSWDETADGMQAIFEELAERSRAAASLKTEPLYLGGADARLRLLVTVDTEEAFDWRRFDGDYHVTGVEGVERFQAVCRDAGAEPLYFLTWPVMKDRAASACFESMVRAGEAAAGLHLHSWTTPPDGPQDEYYSFQKNLPRAVYREKLATLVRAFTELFGEPARAHRGGRYGVGRADYALLAEAGLAFDFSPAAGFDFSARGGPDFSAMSNRPFVADTDGGRVFVTPVTGLQTLRGARAFLRETAPPGFANYRRDRLSALKTSMRLSPEGATLKELQALTRSAAASGAPVLTFTLHSTSLTPGASPYARNAQEADEIISRSGAYLSWFRASLGGEIVSLNDLEALYRNACAAA